MKKCLKHLSFQSLRQNLSTLFAKLQDNRQQAKVKYPIHDVVMSGFATMYFQDPSLLHFQKRLEESQGRSNLQTLFGVESTPEDTQMRDILDTLDRQQFRPAFKEFMHRLQRGKHLEQYQLWDKSYLCVIDGTEYFSSEKIKCPSCLEKNHGKSKTYSHQILQGAIVHPDLRQVVPLMPEEIRNTDGTSKQDCESNASKRFLKDLRQDHPQLKITIGGDGLNSKQPMIEAIRSEKMNFILVAKPDDHKIMLEWINEQRALGEVKTKIVTDELGRIHQYEWINSVPLNGNKETIDVNFFAYQMIVTDKAGEQKITYKNSWITDFEVSDYRVADLVRSGRCRWKIENECFNTLKNQGYCIDHNYGHGQKNLSFNFLLLTLLAFFFHQIAELTDRLYQQCRIKHGSKRHMWETLRSVIKYIIFDTWEILFGFVLNPNAYGAPFRPTLKNSE